MVKRYYIQDYSESFRGNTENNSLGRDDSLTRQEKKTPIWHVVRADGFLQVVNLNKVRK